MKRVGIKYISPGERGIPAVNSGKWNKATDMSYDFGRILGEVGIEPEDSDSVELFMRYVDDGMFLAAAKRKFISRENKWGYEALWMFVPGNIEIEGGEIVDCIEQLPMLFDHKYAFTGPEAFQDILPGIFFKEFPEIEVEGEIKDISLEKERMKGNRVGYISLESREELEFVVKAGFKKQYRNFGLILLSDNPVRVEDLLPGILIPEMTMPRLLVEPQEDNKEEEEVGDSEIVDNEELLEEIPGDESADDGELSLEKGDDDISETSEEVEESIIENESDNDQELSSTPESRSEAACFLPVDNYPPMDTNQQEKRDGDFDWKSFILGFLTATIIFVIIMLVR